MPVGACMPGLVDPVRGRVRHAVNLEVESLDLAGEPLRAPRRPGRGRERRQGGGPRCLAPACAVGRRVEVGRRTRDRRRGHRGRPWAGPCVGPCFGPCIRRGAGLPQPRDGARLGRRARRSRGPRDRRCGGRDRAPARRWGRAVHLWPGRLPRDGGLGLGPRSSLARTEPPDDGPLCGGGRRRPARGRGRRRAVHRGGAGGPGARPCLRCRTRRRGWWPGRARRPAARRDPCGPRAARPQARG